jgi:hypothetical protein
MDENVIQNDALIAMALALLGIGNSLFREPSTRRRP